MTEFSATFKIIQYIFIYDWILLTQSAFKGFCPQDTGTYPLCSTTQGWPCSYDGSGQGACSGDWTGGVIADQVIVSKGLKPGK
jgi:hypothetical protein